MHAGAAAGANPGAVLVLLRGGDILLRTRGGSNQAVLITEALTPTVAVSPLLVLRVRGGVELAPQYLHWLLNSPAMQEQLDREARGTTIRMISAASVRQLSVPVPRWRARCKSPGSPCWRCRRRS